MKDEGKADAKSAFFSYLILHPSSPVPALSLFANIFNLRLS
jgi:hypothetical protein